MKKILLLTIVAISLMTGCTFKKTSTSYLEKTDRVVNSNSFNDETYIWESFNFTTNKVEGI